VPMSGYIMLVSEEVCEPEAVDQAFDPNATPQTETDKARTGKEEIGSKPKVTRICPGAREGRPCPQATDDIQGGDLSPTFMGPSS